MTALGAISVIGDGAPLSPGEVEAFAETHVRLLGLEVSAKHVASKSAAFRLGTREQAGRNETDGARWALSVGAVHCAGLLLDASLDSLDGQFAAITHDAGSSLTRMIADPFALQRYYVGQRGRRLFASTSALALARTLGAEPDPVGVGNFLVTGLQIGRRTIWAGVERLDPGEVVEVVNGQKRRSVYWSPTVDDSLAHESLRELTEWNTENLVGTSRDYLKDTRPLLADLTGGFDSRLLTLSLRRAGVSIVSTTTGSEHHPDIVIARQIARELGLEWRWNPPPAGIDPERAEQVLDEAVAWTDGHLNALEALPVLASHARNGREFSRLINGGGGEHLRFYPWAQEFPMAGRSRRVNYARWMNYRILSPIDVGLFRQDPVPAVRRDLLERMRPTAVRYARHPNTVQLDALNAYKMTGHFGAWMSLARRDLDVELPYYWKPVFGAAFSTSYRYRNHNRLIREMIAQLNPDVARLPTERGGPAEPWRPSNVHRFAPFYTRQLRNLIPRVTHRLTGRALMARSEVPGHPGIVPLLLAKGALDPARMRSAPLYDTARLNDLLASQANPEAPPSSFLGRVLTVERALALMDRGMPASPVAGT